MKESFHISMHGNADENERLYFYVDEYMVVTNGRYELKIRNYKNKAIKFYWFMS